MTQAQDFPRVMICYVTTATGAGCISEECGSGPSVVQYTPANATSRHDGLVGLRLFNVLVTSRSRPDGRRSK